MAFGWQRNERGDNTGHHLGSQGMQMGGFTLHVAVAGSHHTPTDAPAFSLLSLHLFCLSVHYSMINQAMSVQDFYSVKHELPSSASSSPIPHKN